jgi:glycosyltransferase involved in cell wall biosynthesis
MPGKLNAHTVLVANERTRRALPRGIGGRVIELVENGVDLTLFSAPSTARTDRPPSEPVRFVFAGRLVDWKGVDHLLRAVSLLRAEVPLTLDILGDGIERPRLEALSKELDLCRIVTFHGWLPQPEVAARMRSADVFVLPSLWECGGAVVLEAMAAGVPVIATAWGGPADYLDASTGILVPPTNPSRFQQDLASAMAMLARDPALRLKLGRAARAKVESEFDWEHKIDRILEVYRSALGS